LPGRGDAGEREFGIRNWDEMQGVQ
jgi:hypothetical protein